MSLIKLKPVRQHLLLRNLQILLIEPNTAVANIVADLLKSEGATVEIAGCLATALQAVQQTRPDLILCNLVLPDANGDAAIQQIRQVNGGQNGLQSNYRSIQAIAIAPCPLKIERQRAISTGFQSFLFHPTVYSELMQVIIPLFSHT